MPPVLMKSLLFILLVAGLQAADPVELKLWPDGAPGKMQPHSQATDDFIRTKAGKSTITDIHDPTITVYRPEKPNGTSVIVAPGGGYVFLSAIHEGTQVCEWLNSIGVTALLLKYRTPTRDEAAPHEKPVQDAARAIVMVREHAKEWNLDPDRVGLLGFSAGGNLLAHIACDRDSKMPLGATEVFGDVPEINFGIMIYGGGFVDFKEPTKLKEDFAVPADAPPMFIACAHDDGQNPTAATVLYLEYKKHNIPCELHLFTKGGHGFGMRDNKQPINQWSQRCAEWMGSFGWLSLVDSFNTRIKKREDTLKALADLAKPGGGVFLLCGNDMLEFKNLKLRIQEKKAEGKLAEVVELQKRHDEMSKWIEEGMKEQVIKPETLIEDINRLKKEKLELEAERDQLLQSQAKP